MAVNVRKLVGAGAAYVDWGTLDSTGYLQGGGIAAPTAADVDGSEMVQLVGVNDFPWQPSAAERPTVTGDDGAIARFLFNPVELPASDPTFHAADYDFDAAAMSLLVQDIGGGSFLMRNPSERSYRDIVWLVTSQAKTILDGATAAGLSHWESLLILTTNVEARGRSSRQTATANADYTYGLISNFASQYPWGLAFSAVLNGSTQAAAFDFSWPYKPKLQRWTGDNIVVSWNLSQNIAEDSADNIVVYQDGVELTWVTGAPGAGEFGVTEAAQDLLVTGTAPTAAAKMVALFGRL